MPVHDWSQMDAGTFHAFHTAWITHLSETLNGGLLPPSYYALPEQHGGRWIVDVLTLQVPEPPTVADGGLAVAENPPRVRRKVAISPTAWGNPRTLTIRHVSSHRIIALVEIVSPANKDRAAHVAEFADKAEATLRQGIHLLVVDLFPPGLYDPQGIDAVIWRRFDEEPSLLPPNEPLTLASYVADSPPVAYLEHLAVGSPLVEMPLFLNPDRYINVPLESTYLDSYRGLPGFCRDLLEGRPPG